MVKHNQNIKGFTLIELLAVIIILGVLMIIAIPSVTTYIQNSRKSAYIDTAKQIIGAARNLVNSGKLELYDKDVTYYIDGECIPVENSYSSPYGEFDEAYVVVTYDGDGYDYYWTSIDVTGQGIKTITKYDNLTVENISSNLKTTDLSTTTGINQRSKTVLIDKDNNCKKRKSIQATRQINGDTGKEIKIVIYPEGKEKDSVSNGDIVKIDTEEFYVVGREGDRLLLFTKYVLDPRNGLDNIKQNSNCNVDCAVPYSSGDYWQNNVGNGKTYPGKICTESYQYEDCAYIYDDNSNVKQYVDAYVNYLNDIGMSASYGRLLNKEEIYNIHNSDINSILSSAVSGYWTGAPYLFHKIVLVRGNGNETAIAVYDQPFSIRPIIIF